MMSRLLSQIGVQMDWIDRWDSNLVSQSGISSTSGTFFVADAATEVDSKGRKIIASQDFVARMGVRSVCGFGTAYLGTDTFITLILFLRDTIDKSTADQFQMVVNSFKMHTVAQAMGGKIVS